MPTPITLKWDPLPILQNGMSTMLFKYRSQEAKIGGRICNKDKDRKTQLKKKLHTHKFSSSEIKSSKLLGIS